MKKCNKGLGHTPYIPTLDSRGNHNPCPACRKEYSRLFHQRRKNTAEYIERRRQNEANWYDTRKDSEDFKLLQRANRLKARYWPHLTPWEALAQYEKMLAEQNYCCRICEVHQEEYESSFNVDHCHRTQKPRGLLCSVCNRYVVGGIDMRAKAKKVFINKLTLINNIVRYFKETDPDYQEAQRNAII